MLPQLEASIMRVRSFILFAFGRNAMTGLGRKSLIGAFLLGVSTLTASAGSHYEVNWIPMGFAQIPAGTHEQKFILPPSASGHLPLGIVMVSSRPKKAVSQPPVVGSDQPLTVEQQIPAKLKFTIGTKALPDWDLQDYNTAYVINLGDVRANPGFENGNLTIQVTLESEVEGIAIPMVAMPDVLVLPERASGPLLELIQETPDPVAKQFLQALFFDLGGDKINARKSYEALSQSDNERIARMARRGLRKLAYDGRPHNPSGNLNERYRWGLYLQQAGLYSQAFNEFDEARIIDPKHADSFYRAGEMAERMNTGPIKLLDYMQRAGYAVGFQEPAVWYALVIIERKRGGTKLSNADLRAIKEHWLLGAAMIWGATGGRLRIATTFYEVLDYEPREYVTYAEGLEAPAEDLIGRRGWFDSVISIRPRLPEEQGKPSITVGPDQGPRGAALSATYIDSTWPQYMRLWYEHYLWAIRAGEVISAVPDGEALSACGTQPPHNIGTSVRSVMRYHLAGDECMRPRIADTPVPGGYVDLWQIDGPYPVKDTPPAEGPPQKHVLDPLPAAAPEKTIRVNAETDFINLAEVFPGAGWALARATAWVYSPADQDVRMWIGQNDGAAVWLNGACIHRGDYYSAHKFADRNLVDTVASYAPLRAGWNELTVVVESWPAPLDRGWGFSIRFSKWNNEPVPGLAYLNSPPSSERVPVHSPPPAGEHYDWRAVQDDFRDKLPALKTEDIERITGLSGVRFAGTQDANGGYFAVMASGQSNKPGYRAMDGVWDSTRDRDVVVNNVLDWMRESCCLLSYQKGGVERALLFVKPEAVEIFGRLLAEPAEARMVFGDRTILQRALGHVRAPAGTSERLVFVFDVIVGPPSGWPADEEDLLDPISPVFVPNPKKVKPSLEGPPGTVPGAAPSASPVLQ
ncbi:MAG: hypothetical protein HBSAPP02_29430 [Phycisphaerae bacterium]|nr:MAG: hypothetical protein HRU71_01875 [Planctomycetia bacterium]RIK66039.1 MAG: hypothetical protein DCC66_13760 [Planctomycetota bacterium]GJQ27911.1 MAG: hypothetical protein HBSAPP02_29430 [Phycisphaerae bacterium]